MKKIFKYREFEKILRKNGFKFVRTTNGSHRMYRHEDGREIVMPVSSKTINKILAGKIIKKNGLKI